MQDELPDHYSELELTPNATAQEIRSAYRKLAMKYHEDVNSSDEARERIRKITAAGQTLTNPGKKAEYDAKRKEKELELLLKQYGEILEGIINTTNLSGKNTNNKPPEKGKKEMNDYFLFPENEGLGLLQGLIKAYSSEKEGMWIVRKSLTDKNRDIPTDLYLIQRTLNQVIVYRKLTDWNWKTNIFNRKGTVESSYGKKDGEEPIKFNPNDFIDERYFTGKGKFDLDYHIKVPDNYASFLFNMKQIAHKIAFKKTNDKGQYDFSAEQLVINGFSRSNHYIFEGTSYDKKGKNARKIPFKGFFDELSKAESLVRKLEKPLTNKEGQMRSPEQQRPSSMEGLG